MFYWDFIYLRIWDSWDQKFLWSCFKRPLKKFFFERVLMNTYVMYLTYFVDFSKSKSIIISSSRSQCSYRASSSSWARQVHFCRQICRKVVLHCPKHWIYRASERLGGLLRCSRGVWHVVVAKRGSTSQHICMSLWWICSTFLAS